MAVPPPTSTAPRTPVGAALLGPASPPARPALQAGDGERRGNGFPHSVPEPREASVSPWLPGP